MKGDTKGRYVRVVLTSGHGKYRTEYVHRLVALTFLENKNGYTYVHHIDGDKHNNNADNLM